MKIDVTSMFFNSRIEGQTATPAWGTSIGQNRSRECRIDDFKQEIVDMVIGMTYRSISDLNKLDVSRGSSDRDVVICSVFDNVYINNTKLDNVQYTLLLVREHSKSHDGRLLISYAPYIKYNGIANQECINVMQEKLGCSSEGCWFVYDITIKNQSDLYFNAVVVNSTSPMIYSAIRSRNRSEEWKAMIPTDYNYTSVEDKYKSGLQIIYYGAPGTGKSYEINKRTLGKEVIRTTFHPDSDYSTFVGAYKPTSIEVPVRDVTGKVIVENGTQVTENRIVYEFVEQAFLQAYTNAWKAYANAEAGEKPTEQYLVIEEINRGNCAQIFGDLFQLLDRNYAGFSDYPIAADKDMKKQLAKAFKDLTIADAERINAIYDKDIVAQVLKGDVLLLPDNLYIWATMNTSDQSLFPIDSAFKRRWDWKYIPISEGKDETGNKLNYMIKVRGKLYGWWNFVEKINNEIGELTKSEDKKLGYFFCKANNGVINAETFVSKVVFYLWNDVFKDQDLGTLFVDENGDDLTFSSFYKVDDFGKPMVREDKVERFLKNLGVEEVDEMTYNSEEDEVISDSEPGSRRILHVEFDGEDIAIKRFPQYLQVLKKIGLDRAEAVASEKQTQVLGCALITKEPEAAIEESYEYNYVESDGYYVVKGIKGKVMLEFLPTVSDRYDLNLKIEYR